MACPLFVPGVMVPGSPGASPLGSLFQGRCEAGGPGDVPDNLVQFCNYGYGRGACERAAVVQVDAVRFRVVSHAEGAIGVAWSSERDHHPVAVGSLQLTESGEAASVLELQARACVSVYLRKTGRNW